MGYAVRIKDFGGLVPRASARELPDNAAQIAINLDPTTREFRPLHEDTQVVANTGLTSPSTLYRLDRVAGGAYNTDMTANWVPRAGAYSFVKGQLNNDATERTFASSDDSAAPPRAYDVTDMVTGRQLGVPAPTVKPTITVNTSDEFSVDERPTAITSAYNQVVTAIRANMIAVWVGAAEPGTTTTGYVNLQDNGPAAATQPMQARVYRTTSQNGAKNGALSNTYSSYGVDSFGWVLDPLVSPFWSTSDATSPAWQGGAVGAYWDHICIGFHAYGLGYRFDTSQLGAELAAIAMPGTTDGTKLLTTDQISGADGIVTRLVNYAATTGAAAPKIDALKAKVAEIKVLLDGGTIGSNVAQMTAFYAKAEIASLMDKDLDNIAADIYDSALGCFLAETGAGSYAGDA